MIQFRFLSHLRKIAALFLICCPLLAAADDLPDGTKMLLSKLETFESEKRQSLDSEIKQKRAQVVDLLKGKLTRHPPGSAEAKAVESAISQLKDLDSTEPFSLSSIKVSSAPMSSKNTQINFELIQKRLMIVARNQDQRVRLGGELMLEVRLDNQPLFSAKKEGVYVLEIDPDGKLTSHEFRHIGRDKQRANEAERDRLIKLLRNVDPANIVILTKVGACNALSVNRDADDIVEIIGGRENDLPFRTPYICIGYHGLRRGDAVEVKGEDRNGKPAEYAPGKG